MGNYLAILVCGIASMIVGAFWYSPAGFGNTWMKLMKFTTKDIEKAKKKGMGPAYFLNFVAALLMAAVLSKIVGVFGAMTAAAGVKIGFKVWLGFIATVTLGGTLWEGKPWKLWILNNAYWLVMMLIMGAILGAWQ